MTPLLRNTLAGLTLLVTSGLTQAATVEVTLTSHLIGRPAEPPFAFVIKENPTWTFDEVSGTLAADGRMFVRSQLTPTSVVYDIIIDDLVIANGLASAAFYSCTDGSFSMLVGANMCGNYVLGADYIDNSILTYGPGTSVSKTLLGDDEDRGPPQSIIDYNLLVASYTGPGGVLVMQTADWNPASSAGLQMSFTVAAVPAPASAWLLATGLAGLLARRMRRSAT